MLPGIRDPAVLELEDDAAIGIDGLAAARAAVVMQGDHAAVVIGKHMPQRGPEGSREQTVCSSRPYGGMGLV